MTDRRQVAAWVLTATLSLRVVLDLLWWVELPWANLPRSASAVLAAGAVGLVLGAGTAARRHPLWWPCVAFLATLCLGLLRAPDAAEGVRLLVQYGSAPVVGLACAVWLTEPRSRARLAIVVGSAGLIPVAVSWVALVGGQPAENVLHGYPRLIGGYRNLHAHALAMAMLCTLGIHLSLRRPSRPLGLVLAVGAGVCLAATWVRTGAMFVGVVVTVLLVVRRRWGALVLMAGASLLAILAIPSLRDRYSDLWTLLSLSRPPEGWDWVGTGRFGMWRKSLAAFLALPVTDVVLGTGLGGHRTFWRGVNPHNDYLLLLYQLGPLGLCAYLWALGTLAWRLGHAGSDSFVRFGLAVAAGMIVLDGLSNTFVSRLTVAWLAWGFSGAALSVRSTAGAPSVAPGGRPDR